MDFSNQLIKRIVICKVTYDQFIILNSLKSAGQSILLVDKNIDALTRIADRHYIIEKGKVVWDGTSSELQGDQDLQHRFLGV